MNKQIEEMGREIAYNVAWDEDELQTVDCLETAKRLYNAGFRKRGEWIPVTERLPDWRDGKVLVFTKYGFSICERTVNSRWQGKHANWITHWMPLPEPPETEKGGD